MYDYIIVGQGIAGSLLADALLRNQKKIFVFDEHNPNAASNIAAGVVNPVTGRKMVKSWMIDEILPHAKNIYRNLEERWNVNFFFDQPLYKIFASKEDADIWNEKQQQDAYAAYLGDIIPTTGNDAINAPYGIGRIQQACWMDVPAFIKLYRNYLKQQQIIAEEKLDIEALEIADVITYKTIQARHIIFCDGYKASLQSLFSFIPFTLAKGEQLVIHAPELNDDKVYTKNIFLIPKHVDTYTIGASFVWDDLTEEVTDAGRKEIISKLENMIRCNYTIIEERAGIRPTIHDRRPVIGRHPEYKNVHIFNGMGTKGVSLAPYLADYYVGILEQEADVFREISVNRFVV